MKRDALETLGSIITADEVRDAVHVACLPAKADEDLLIASEHTRPW